MTDTICAIATSHGVGSIAIIRISGVASLDIAKKISKRNDFKPRYATLTSIYDTNNQPLDEVIVIYFKAPFSFTGEDIIEIQCHGGIIVAQMILKTVLALDARLAMPGEFSKRAFLNNKMDLSKAEAIAKLIETKSEDAAKILATQIKGSLKRYIDTLRDEMLYILAFSEVSIDYAEEDLPQDLIQQIMTKLNSLHVNLDKILKSSELRSGLMQGFKVAIVGKPNVGKSSLLNMLLEYNRAIVSEIAGTTRDTIEEQIKIGTHLIRIIDTAGIRNSDNEIEQIGIERSIKAIKESDIVVALFDNSKEFDYEDEIVLKWLEQYQKSKDIIIILNKIDLKNRFDTKRIAKYSYLEENSQKDTQILINKLEQIIDKNNNSDEIMLISLRQIEIVKQVLKAIQDAKEPLINQELEIFSFHITEAINAISQITKPFENDEMLDKMFGSFCLGK